MYVYYFSFNVTFNNVIKNYSTCPLDEGFMYGMFDVHAIDSLLLLDN